MRRSEIIRLMLYSMKILIFQREIPLFATVILTDKCNLSCKHCCLHNYRDVGEEDYSLEHLYADLLRLYQKGVRILCFSGGEIALWENKDRTIRQLVKKAKEIGFFYVTLATNGTIPLDYGDADFVLMSIDGTRDSHNAIRGDTYDQILGNIRTNASDRIAIFMELNQINKQDIRSVCILGKEEKNICAVSFNFHTPFIGTESLALSYEEKRDCLKEIEQLKKEGYQILNLESCFQNILDNNFKKPCKQLMVLDHGDDIICNRCSKEKGLCDQCGYFETVEIARIFSGNPRVCLDALLTYGRILK